MGAGRAAVAEHLAASWGWVPQEHFMAGVPHCRLARTNAQVAEPYR